MNRSDFEEFTEQLEAITEMKGRDQPSDNALTVWFRLLAPYQLKHCLMALDELTKKSPFVPTPDGVIKEIVTRDGRPTSDEAWATALTASDEGATVLWTDEIAQALSMGASDLLAGGDKTAARMAFRDSYNRLVDQARSDCRPINTWVSLGHDASSRNSVIKQAEVKGLLTHEKASSLLLEETTSRGDEFKALVSGLMSESDKEKRNKNWIKIKEALT